MKFVNSLVKHYSTKKTQPPDFITALSLRVCADLPGTNLSLSLSLVSFV